MSRLSRFLPRFLRSDKEKKLNNEAGTENKSICKILFLDETEFNLPYKGNLKGQLVLDKVYEQLNLFEKDYFGLRFIDETGQTHWLEYQKSLSTQMKGCKLPYTLYFGVKFYPADPCKLREEITRYLFFLQVKRDILHGRLPVSFEDAAELFAFAVQSELGDFDPNRLAPGYVSEFQFVPNQTEELEDQIAGYHRRLSGIVPATAELNFLDKVKWFDMYGVDLHPVRGEGSTDYFLGLTPTGIVVYKNKTKVGNYFWPRITKVNFKGKVFIIKVKDKINEEHVYAFELTTKAACKHLWKCCIEHHAFFRLNQLGEPPPKGSKQFSFTSKHRNSGRQDRRNNAEQNTREQPQVLRVQSRRQARRAMSDTRLHDTEKGVSYTDGHITMVVRPEPVKGARHRSLPDLKGRESPRSTRSAPWETNADAGMYTSGRESPVSFTQSENVRYHRKNRDSDSESGYRRKQRWGYESDGGRVRKHHHHSSGGHRSRRSGYESDPFSGGHRRKYFPSSRKGSDNESDVSFSRRRRREVDSGSESDISPKYTARQRKAKSMGPDNFEREWNSAMQHVYIPGKENLANGSVPSLHSAPGGEARQKKLRRRRSKSPNTKRPPEELRQHIEFELVDPGDLTEEQMREIPFTKIETKAEPFKVKYSPKTRHRYRSPKRKSAGDLESNIKVYQSEEPPPPYTRTPDRTPETQHRVLTKPSGYYSDTNSFVSMPRKKSWEAPTSQPPQLNDLSKPPPYKDVSSVRPRVPPETRRSAVNAVTHNSSNMAYVPNNTQSNRTPQSSVDTQARQEDSISVISNNLNLNRHVSLLHKVNNVQWKHNDLRYTRSLNSTTDSPQLNTDTLPDQSNRSTPEVNSDLGSQGQGQGHDLDDEERNRDSGLNSSVGSGSGIAQTPPRNAGRIFGTQNDIARLYSSPQNRMYNARGGNQPNNMSGPQSASQTVKVNQSTLPQSTGSPAVSSRHSSPVKYDQYSPAKSVYNQVSSPSSSYNTGYNQTSFQPSYTQNHTAVSQNSLQNQSSQNNQISQTGPYTNSSSHNMLYSHSPMRNETYNQSVKQNGFGARSHGQYGSPSSSSSQTGFLLGSGSQTMFYNQSPSKPGNPQQTGPALNSVQRNLFYTPPSTQHTSYHQSTMMNGSHTTPTSANQSSSPATFIQPSGYTPSAYTQKVSGTQGMGQHYVKRASQSPTKYNNSPGKGRQYSVDAIGQNSLQSTNQSFASNKDSSSSINFRSPDSAIGSTNSYRPGGDYGTSGYIQNPSMSGSRLSGMSSVGTSPNKMRPNSGPAGTSSVKRSPNYSRSDVWTEI